MKKEYISPTLCYFESELMLDTCIPSVSNTAATTNPDDDLVKEERDEWNDGLW